MIDNIEKESKILVENIQFFELLLNAANHAVSFALQAAQPFS